MANTTYDDIYEEFIANCSTDDINLPNTDEKRYIAIHSAIRKFNSVLRTNLVWNDELEEVDKELNQVSLLALSHFLKVAFLENQLTHLTTTYSTFQKEIGIRYYQEMSRNFKQLIKDEKDEIEDIFVSNSTGDDDNDSTYYILD